MAPKHDEIVKPLSDGWTVAWDATAIDPTTRKQFDKVIAENARALREVLRESAPQAAPRPVRGRGAQTTN